MGRWIQLSLSRLSPSRAQSTTYTHGSLVPCRQVTSSPGLPSMLLTTTSWGADSGAGSRRRHLDCSFRKSILSPKELDRGHLHSFTQADQRQVGEKRPVGGVDSGHHSPLHQCGDGGLATRDLFLSPGNISNPKPDSVSHLHTGSWVLR